MDRWRPGRTELGLAVASWGLFWEIASGYWDVYSHQIQFRSGDPWWNPAHFSIYSGVVVAEIAWLWAYRQASPGALRPGLRALGVGVLLQIAAGAFNEAWHRLSGPSMTLEPPHVLLVIGMIIATFGSITGLATAVALRGRGWGRGPWSLFTDLSLAGAFAAMWLVVVGSMIFVASRSGSPRFDYFMIVAGLGALVAVPAARSAPWLGFTSAIGALLAVVNLILIAVFFGTYVPLSIVPFALLDGIHALLTKRLGPVALSVVAGCLFGSLAYMASYPFTIGVLDPPGLNPATLLAMVAGALGGLGANILIRGTGNWVRRSGEAAI